MNSCATALIVRFHFIERTTLVKFAVYIITNQAHKSLNILLPLVANHAFTQAPI